VDIPAFRSAFPEFADTVAYPTETVNFWVTIAEAQVRKCRWANLWTQGVNLYVAHQIVLARQNVKAAKVGGAPGQQGGIATSKTVGSMSVAFDAANASEKDAGLWNLTTYGKQFIHLARIAGAGPVQL
jgi:hypothetical protein